MTTIFDLFEKFDTECRQRKERALKDYLQGLKDSRKGIFNDCIHYHREDKGAAYDLGWNSSNNPLVDTPLF